jgi:hypothetical protein
MKVKLLCSRAGRDFSNSAGEVVDVEEKEALAMIKAGQAESVSKVERATKKAKSETAVKVD